MLSLLGDAIVYIGWGIFTFLIVLAIVLYFFIKQKLKKDSHNSKPNLKNIDGSASLTLNIPYLYKKEISFLKVLDEVLPKDYVAYPRVGVDNLVKPYGNLVLYNEIRSKYVDACIFLRKNMQPVAVIDLVDLSIGDSTIEEQDTAVTQALKGVHIPVISIIIKTEYDRGELLEKFLDALDPLAIAELKKNSQTNN